MLKVGITGGIGSGKSVVSDLIRLLGYPVYNSDNRAKELSDTDDTIHRSLMALLGDEIYKDSHLNRTLLASRMFGDTSKIAAVNAIIHPVVFADFKMWCAAQSSPLIFAESAILVESGFSSLMDKIILVDAPEVLRLQRVMERDNTTADMVQQRMKAQFPVSQLRICSDYVIHNDNKQLLISQILCIIKNLLSL